MTGSYGNDGRQKSSVGPVKLVADVWFIIMSLLSPSDIVHLSHTCKALFEYSRFHHVWQSALAKHHFLSKIYPHLRHAPTSIIRRQLITTTRLDVAFSKCTLRPTRSYSFPLEFPGVFQGMKFIPGGDWLVLLFHSRTLNPARHSNICLFKPPRMESSATDATPTSVTLQSEWCWLHFGSRDGPYKSSRGDDLMLLRTFVKNKRTFAICHLDTKTPSVKITFMAHTTIRTRNYVVAGDYLVYGWITDDRKHMLRIMKLNDDYTKLEKDVIAEIDCPPGNDGRLMVRYDLRLSGKQPRLMLISTRLMAAYDISDDTLSSGSRSLPLKLPTVWTYLPEDISFGRILHVFHESAIVTFYEGKVRFVYPEIDNLGSDGKTIATYQFSPSTPYSVKYPAILTSQRIFWPLRFPRSLPASVGSKHLIEAAMLPAPSNEERHIDRILIDHDELSPDQGSLMYDAQDWDELSGKLCIRYVKSRYPHEFSWRKTSWRFTILDMV
ncbi:hypothetical protein JVT61DRAFT_10917 [Boletus reticuloceps]|uniref:F-box domain-containing protein n=1 Tax=Boletus reticuloceps TaxID=495285 RepID=A0A8I2YF64_9AGAM|nr:hypothetical protein JVT61DRAFT_10917 [Boletus reticuloceps]